MLLNVGVVHSHLGPILFVEFGHSQKLGQAYVLHTFHRITSHSYQSEIMLISVDICTMMKVIVGKMDFEHLKRAPHPRL